MENLGQIPNVNKNIRTATVKAVRALHKFIFEEDGDRGNRKRLREFRGFTFREGTETFRNKVQYVKTNLLENDLTSICNILGLDYAGTKDELINKICNGLLDIDSLQQYEDDNEEEEEEEEDVNELTVRRADSEREEASESEGDADSTKEDKGVQKQKNDQCGLNLNIGYKEIEDSIRCFDGKGNCTIERWISDFEEIAALFEFNELQKLVFAKKSLKGLAKVFIQGEGVVKSWKKLKALLLEEFATRLNSAQLHEMLQKRRMQRDETVQEYFLAMKELAARGNVEFDAIIKHVIDSITDDTSNKIVLYGSRNFKDFKERIKVYDTLRQQRMDKPGSYSRGKDDPVRKKAVPRKQDAKSDAPSRCYNCGESGHKSFQCEAKALGTQCFKCNKFGHKAIECKERLVNKIDNIKDSKAEINSLVVAPVNRMCKTIVVKGIELNAPVDTGNQISILSETACQQIGKPTLHDSGVSLLGFGKSSVTSLGYFQTTVYIDNSEFPVTLHVVPDNVMTVNALIGTDILSQAEVRINADGILITPASHSVLTVLIDEHKETTVNINPACSERVSDEVRELVAQYEPNQIKDVGIEMSIIVKDEQPIYERPRRLPLPEQKIVEEQVEEWLEK